MSLLCPASHEKVGHWEWKKWKGSVSELMDEELFSQKRMFSQRAKMGPRLKRCLSRVYGKTIYMQSLVNSTRTLCEPEVEVPPSWSPI